MPAGVVSGGPADEPDVDVYVAAELLVDPLVRVVPHEVPPERPLVYVTEMVAFFQRDKAGFNKYTKSTFGIVHVRTDGERVLVVTNSGKTDQKEAYAFSVNARGETAFEDKVQPI